MTPSPLRIAIPVCAIVLLFCVAIVLFRKGENSSVPDLPELKIALFDDDLGREIAKLSEEFSVEHQVKVRLIFVRGDNLISGLLNDSPKFRDVDLVAIDEPFLHDLKSKLVAVGNWPKNSQASLDFFKPSEFVKAFNPKVLEAFQTHEGAWGVPISSNVYLYAYRSDLLQKIQLKQNDNSIGGVPSNLEEFVEVSRSFHNPPEIYGFLPIDEEGEGLMADFVWALSFNLRNRERWGSPGHVSRTLSLYLELFSMAPSRENLSESWGHESKIAAFAAGKAPHVMLWPGFIKRLELSSFSKVAGLVAYEGIKQASVRGAWMFGLLKTSKMKPNAVDFVQWVVSQKTQRKLATKGLVPVNKNVLEGEEFAKKHPWFPATKAALEDPIRRPQMKGYAKKSGAISSILHDILMKELNVSKGSQLLFKSLQDYYGLEVEQK